MQYGKNSPFEGGCGRSVRREGDVRPRLDDIPPLPANPLLPPSKGEFPSACAAFLFVFFLFLTACSSGAKTDFNGPPPPTNLSGETLAHQYCQRCHLFPEPALLDKKTWQYGVLPNMRMRLGFTDKQNPYANFDYEDILEVAKSDAYPAHPQLAEADYQKIEQFYLRLAPDSLPPQPAKPPLNVGLTEFEPVFFRAPPGLGPGVTKVLIEETNRRIAVGEQNGRIRFFDPADRVVDSLLTDSAPADLVPLPNGGYWALSMGIMRPNDQPKGNLNGLNFGQAPKLLLQHLRRPVQVTRADLNADNQPDALVCEYGNHVGKLAWYEFPARKPPVEHVLRDVPGARCTYLLDFNGDGRPDILALMAQALEGVSVFLNEGNGNFHEEVLLSFPPVYGSSYLSVLDADGDGDPDLLYANGDNADYSPVLKPYHGIRLFLNEKGRFRQAWFYPLHGVQQAEARDFDGDGDLDVAAISFFPNPAQPREGFVFLKNKGAFRFTAHTFVGAQDGNWLTMACGDADGDGDADIALGSYRRRRVGRQEIPKNGFVEWVLLKNRGPRFRAVGAR